MKKILPLFIVCLLVSVCHTTRAKNTELQNVDSGIDSVIVVGWFNKLDTLDYWIYDTQWVVDSNRTVQTANLSTNIRIEVTDSTAEGYTLQSTVVRTLCDTIHYSPSANAQTVITQRICSRIEGHTTDFETDEFGKITKFNKNKTKKQIKSLLKEGLKDIASDPEIAKISESGIDVEGIKKSIDIDKLADSYTENISILFRRHGTIYPTGETLEHKDGAPDDFDTDTYTYIEFDKEFGTYRILNQTTFSVPESITEAMYSIDGDGSYSDIDPGYSTTGIIELTYGSEYTPEGWPYNIIHKWSYIINYSGKIIDKHITLRYHSLKNNSPSPFRGYPVPAIY